jgi:hypothetical protein
MQRGIAVLCVAAGLLGGSELAAAHEMTTPATIELAGAEAPDAATTVLSGRLEASGACRAGRKVEIWARYEEWTDRHVWGPGQWSLVGEVEPGANGTFTRTMTGASLWSAKAVVRRVVQRRRGHRHVCGGAVAAVRF